MAYLNHSKKIYFPYGKQKGRDIRNSFDFWQLERMANQEKNIYAIARLKSLGYHIEVEGKLINRKYYEKIKNQEDNITEVLKKGYIEVVPSQNIRGDDILNYLKTEEYGEITFSDTIELKAMRYKDFNYMLPMDKTSGRGILIKNKRLIRLTLKNELIEGKLFATDLHVFTKKELNIRKTLDLL